MPFNQPYVQNWYLGVKNQDFWSLQVFKRYHASYLAPTSPAEIYVQETCADYNTQAAHQNDYHL